MKYRAEIDGLRAIAVISVILYHAGFNQFNGGFVGVDIFFVISGYLITTIIYTEVKNQEFSFKRFYSKRAARILPPLFFVMLACFPFAWIYLLPDHLKEFSKSLEWIPIFVSNVFFMRQSGYFDSAIEIKPLIHTWSLAVEEQYYLFFPILLLIIYQWKRNWTLIFFFTLGLFSFLLTQVHIFSETAIFYLLPTRAWELMVGVCLAIYLSDMKASCGSTDKTTNALSIFGLILVLCSIFFLTNDHPYPGMLTLAPVIGTALIILSRSDTNLTNKFLSHRTLVGIGLVSYSAYLWHQPIFAFARYINLTEPTHLTFIILVTGCFFLAFLTWKYIETPFRKMGKSNEKKTFKLYVIFTIFFIAIGLVGEKTLGFPQRFHQSNELKLKLSFLEYKCNDPSNEFCTFGDSDSKFAVFGDSHVRALMPMLLNINKSHHQPFVISTYKGCPPIISTHLLKNNGDECYLLNNKRLSYLASHPSIKKVFLIGRWTKYTDGDYAGKTVEFLGFTRNDERSKEKSREVFSKELSDTIEAYKKLGVKIYIVLQAPQQQFHSGQVYFYMNSKSLDSAQTQNFINAKSVSLERHKKLQFFNRSQIIKYIGIDGIKVINLDSVFCNNSVCLLGKKNDPYYLDYDHLSPSGALKTSTIFMNAIQN